MSERIYNFSAGPAILPLAVLEEAQRELITLPGVGMSVMEISHRSKTFDEIISVVSHELRTPLASLVGFADLLLTREYPEANRKEFLTIMVEEGLRLTTLINVSQAR